MLFLGLTSLFTDVSSEMVSAVIPVYLTFTLRFTSLEFGIFDGIQQGVTALLRLVSGAFADVRQRHKEVAGVGYGLSAACKAGLLAFGAAWQATVGFLLLDRVGKGIRTAPRDALISLSSPPGELGQSFGVHRALDTFGALLGPIIAFALLTIAPGRFDAIFLSSLCAGVIGLGILGLFVENRGAARADRERPLLATALSSLRRPGYLRLLAAGVVLSATTVSDGFVYLTLQRRSDLDPRFFPLLAVGTALAYLVLAVPAGRLADRVGKRWVLLAGYGVLLAAYGVLLRPTPGIPEIAACLVLHGAYYAATDGVLMALSASVLPPEARATGMAALTTATALTRLVASILFGAIWSVAGPTGATAAFGAGLIVAIAVGALCLRPRPDAGAA